MIRLFDCKQLDPLFSVPGYKAGRQRLGSLADVIPGETRLEHLLIDLDHLRLITS
jgi:hypothetical protein